MGINYYAVPNRPSIRGPIHIGKSSYGWLFVFQYQNEIWNDPPVVWRSYDEVKDWLKKYTVDRNDYVIIDEDDCILDYDEFIQLVDEKQKDEFNLKNKDNFKYNDNVNGYRFSKGEFS